MANHSTNYTATLILPAADCPAPAAKIPAKPGGVAGQQYAALMGTPYGMTGDDLVCLVTSIRKGQPNDAALREVIFSKGQPCMRASPLTKTHGWAIHYDAQGRVALIDPGTQVFRTLVADDTVTKTPAMRNARA